MKRISREIHEQLKRVRGRLRASGLKLTEDELRLIAVAEVERQRMVRRTYWQRYGYLPAPRAGRTYSPRREKAA